MKKHLLFSLALSLGLGISMPLFASSGTKKSSNFVGLKNLIRLLAFQTVVSKANVVDEGGEHVVTVHNNTTSTQGNLGLISLGTLALEDDSSAEIEGGAPIVLGVAFDEAGFNAEEQELSFNFTANVSQAYRSSEDHGKRQLESCESFEKKPRDPGDHISVVSKPWSNLPQVCKLFVKYPVDRSTFYCSGTLVGPYHLLTARHCTFDGCLGTAERVEVKCGYGYASGADDYAHFGTALVTSCWRSTTYDESASCNIAGQDFVGNMEHDIQICRLDRKIGEVLGWWGMTSASLSHIVALGYPAYGKLENYIEHALDKRLSRNNAVTGVGSNHYVLDNMWAWGGESGGPYYQVGGGGRQISAVHHGGPTGCTEYGSRVTSQWVNEYLALRGDNPSSDITPWSDPADHCQIIRLQIDIHDQYSKVLKGVGRSEPIYSSSTQDEGESFKAAVTLHNVGTIAGTVTVKWYASSNDVITDADLYLAESTRTISSEGTYRIIHVNLPVKWSSGVRHIGALWSTDCLTTDGNTAVLGTIEAIPKPETPRPSPRPTLRPTPRPVPQPVATPQPPMPQQGSYPTFSPVKAPTRVPTVRPIPDDLSDSTTFEDDDEFATGHSNDEQADSQGGRLKVSPSVMIMVGAVGFIGQQW